MDIFSAIILIQISKKPAHSWNYFPSIFINQNVGNIKNVKNLNLKIKKNAEMFYIYALNSTTALVSSWLCSVQQSYNSESIRSIKMPLQSVTVEPFERNPLKQADS